MHQITTEYLGSLRTQASHLQSNSQLLTDAPTDNNGKGEAFSPTDLVCTALAACMSTIMGIYANKHDITLENLKADVTKVMSSEPRKIAEIIVDFTLENKNLSDRHTKGLKNAALTCPVALSLSNQLKQTITFQF